MPQIFFSNWLSLGQTDEQEIMANKTVPTKASVSDFLNATEPLSKRTDAFTLLQMMKKITGYEPVLWGSSLVGFGSVRYKYASGRQGDWFLTGFSPRKQNLTLYIMTGILRYEKLLDSLGKYKTGKACLYIKSLNDIDLNVLEELLTLSVTHMQKIHKPT